MHTVVTETDLENAKVLVSQGLDPEFKQKTGFRETFAPGSGISREGTYVASPDSFSKGSYGNVRIHMVIGESSLAPSPEMKQLGRTDVSDNLKSYNGAITKGVIPKAAITKVEVYQGGNWKSYSPQNFLKSVGAESTPKLPRVSAYEEQIKKNAGKWSIPSHKIRDLVDEYNNATLEDKIWLAQDAGLI